MTKFLPLLLAACLLLLPFGTVLAQDADCAATGMDGRL